MRYGFPIPDVLMAGLLAAAALLDFATPNVYFHHSMAYALLRHNGLDIGKRDYVGG